MAGTQAQTRFALLTPPGIAAIATIGVRGPSAWDVMRGLFRRVWGKPLPDSPKAGRFWLARTFVAKESPGDTAVLAVRQAGESPWIEVHSHGGRLCTDEVASLLESRGVLRSCWEDLEYIDSLQQAAARSLSMALTARSAGILLDQLNGALLSSLRRAIQNFETGNKEGGLKTLRSLQRHAAVGIHLTKPWTVAILGAPNVGKSSLVNALCGFERCVVADLPGTTRDVVGTLTALDGWPVLLQDTAGLRRATEGMEAQGVDRAVRAARAADLTVWVLDVSATPIWPQEDPDLYVINKTDLPFRWDPACCPGVVPVSALRREGIRDLERILGTRLVPAPPEPGTPVPFCRALVEAIEGAVSLGDRGLARDAAAALRALMGERA